MRHLLLLLIATIALTGCALTSNVDLGTARAHVETVDTELARVKTIAAALEAQLAEARKLAEATQDANAFKAVAVLSSALNTAQQALPHLEEASVKAKAQLVELEKQGDTVPAWKVIGSLALLLVPKALSLVPGVGPFAEPLSRGVSTLFWAIAGAKSHKQEDRANEVGAAALETQVRFANDLLKGVPPAKAKDDARAALEEAGIYGPVKSLVRAVERETEDRRTPAVPLAG